MTQLRVSEIFGPTLQGEGPSAGTPTMFLRLGRCNLSCQWCDTPYTWDWRGKNGTVYDPAQELRLMDVDAVASQVDSDAKHLVVTGGEPLLQAAGLCALDDLLIERRISVECETNGTRVPPAPLVAWQWNVSPKLANSGDSEARRIVPDVLRTFVDWQRRKAAVCFKFVVANQTDLDEVDLLVKTWRMTNVWLMPEGRDAETLVDRLGWLVPAAVARGYAVTPRLHVLAYGDLRGV